MSWRERKKVNGIYLIYYRDKQQREEKGGRSKNYSEIDENRGKVKAQNDG